MNERELLEFIAAQVGNLTKNLTAFKQETKENFNEMNFRMAKIENNLENVFKPQIEALFDGYRQNTRLLEDIRDEVARHEEVIVKRVK